MMTHNSWLPLAVFGLFCSGLPANAQEGEGKPVAETFSEQIEVTAVELMIEVRNKAGGIPEDLTIADFEVWEDGRQMEVVGLEAPAPPPNSIPVGNRAPAEQTAPWRFVIYFERSLTAPRSIAKSARSLDRQVMELIALGDVEVVLADPSPRVMQAFTRDPERLRAVLSDLAKSSRGSNEVAEIRRQFLMFRDMRIEAGADSRDIAALEVSNQIRSAARQEQLIIDRQLTRFRDWIETYGVRPASVVMLVSDGFDLDPSDFYLEAVTIPGVEQELGTELIRYRTDRSSQELSRQLAAEGWTSLILATKGVPPPDAAADASMAGRDRFRSIGESASASSGPGSGTPFSLLQHPTEPWLQIAEETGGEVLTNLRKTGRALARLGQRFRLTYQADRPADGKRRQLDVRVSRPRLVIQSPKWTRSPTAAGAAQSRVRRLLVLPTAGTGVDHGDLPVDARLQIMPAQGDRTRPQQIQLTILFDLNALRPLLVADAASIRFTIGVALGDGAPFVHQETHQVALPALASKLPRFTHTVTLNMPADIEVNRVGVVVEELGSGSWGAGPPSRANSR